MHNARGVLMYTQLTLVHVGHVCLHINDTQHAMAGGDGYCGWATALHLSARG